MITTKNKLIRELVKKTIILLVKMTLLYVNNIAVTPFHIFDLVCAIIDIVQIIYELYNLD